MQKIYTYRFLILLALVFVICICVYTNTRNNKIQVSMQVPPIVMPMQADSNFNINKYKGKFVFVEFWASWCAPCRNSNQNIVELFHQYQQEKKDVVFVMISLDDKRQNWQKALLQDSLQPMINLIDTLAWKSKVANDFGINSIPASFLINKEGYIVGKDLTKREVQLLIKKME